MVRIMALDIGVVRCGVAISDTTQRIASPLCILNAEDIISVSKTFKNLLVDWEPKFLVVGLPKSMDGTENSQADKVRDIAEKISASTGLEVKFIDERLSSSEAKTYMRECGFSERDMRGKVDAVAASIFLQSYLDAHRQNETI